MNQLSTADRAAIVSALVEGTSIRAICRMLGVGKNTVARLVRDLGRACAVHSNNANVGLHAKRVQCDEIWSFIYSKEKNVPEGKKGELGFGDVWTWTAIDADTKLMISWMVGRRDMPAALAFMHDLASRIVGRPQLSTDGLGAYKFAISDAFQNDVDHGVVRKSYGVDRSGAPGRYSPPVCIGCDKEAVRGAPDEAHISTSFVERANLTMRMGMRRFTRLTNGHSKKLENHECMISLFFTYYNFCRKHETLKATPAQAAGIADHRWTVEELVGLLPAEKAKK